MSVPDIEPVPEPQLTRPSRAGVLWRRFRRNRAAMLGLVLFVAVVLAALLAGVITPATRCAGWACH